MNVHPLLAGISSNISFTHEVLGKKSIIIAELPITRLHRQFISSPSVVFEAVDMPCPGPFHLSHSVDYIYEFCPLPDPDVGLSIFVCDVEHTSFHFFLCGHKFVLCLFGQCPGLCTICHSWQHTGVVHLSLQADGKVAFEDIPVFGVCRPACHDSSLHLVVLVLFLEAVVLSQVHVAWDIFYQDIVHVYKGVVYNHNLCLCDVAEWLRVWDTLTMFEATVCGRS